MTKFIVGTITGGVIGLIIGGAAMFWLLLSLSDGPSVEGDAIEKAQGDL